jgi:hypothetical protein
MSRWFRFYDDVINDPKVLSLPEAMRWTWVAVLCAASKNDGNLPATDHLGLMLRVTKQRARRSSRPTCRRPDRQNRNGVCTSQLGWPSV